jgi:hypothetical protein
MCVFVCVCMCVRVLRCWRERYVFSDDYLNGLQVCVFVCVCVCMYVCASVALLAGALRVFG